MSRNRELAVKSVIKRIREEGFAAVEDLMNLAIQGHLDDRLPEGESYVCPTCRQQTSLLFESAELTNLTGRNRWREQAIRSSGGEPQKQQREVRVVCMCQNCGVITEFGHRRDSAPTILGMMSLITDALQALAEEAGDE